jgi:flagellar biosynthesis regulator FlbT
MVQRRKDLRFSLKPREAIRISGEGLRQDLQRDVALQNR